MRKHTETHTVLHKYKGFFFFPSFFVVCCPLTPLAHLSLSLSVSPFFKMLLSDLQLMFRQSSESTCRPDIRPEKHLPPRHNTQGTCLYNQLSGIKPTAVNPLAHTHKLTRLSILINLATECVYLPKCSILSNRKTVNMCKQIQLPGNHDSSWWQVYS